MTRDPKIYLQLGGTGLLTRTNRRRNERKGLEAIFSSQKEGMKIEVLTGAAGVMAGLFLLSLRYFEQMPCKPSDRGETPSNQLSRLDHLEHS